MEESHGLLHAGRDLSLSATDDADAIEKRNERATREGFAKHRVVWFGGPGDWLRDWIFYVENSHTLVSMCRGHSMHQFDRFDRFTHLCCVLCLNLFISAWLQRERTDAVGAVEYYAWVAVWSVVLVIYDNVLRFLATSPCFQVGGSLYDACFLCRDCCRDCGRQGLYVCLFGSLGLAFSGVLLAIHVRADTSRFFGTFVAMRLFSYVAELAPLSCTSFVKPPRSGLLLSAGTFYMRREYQRSYWTPLPGTDADPKPESWRTGDAYPFGACWPTPDYIVERRHMSERFAHVSEKDTERSAQARRLRMEERSIRAQRLKEICGKRSMTGADTVWRGSPSSPTFRDSATDFDIELGTLATHADTFDSPLDALGSRGGRSMARVTNTL